MVFFLSSLKSVYSTVTSDRRFSPSLDVLEDLELNLLQQTSRSRNDRQHSALNPRTHNPPIANPLSVGSSIIDYSHSPYISDFSLQSPDGHLTELGGQG